MTTMDKIEPGLEGARKLIEKLAAADIDVSGTAAIGITSADIIAANDWLSHPTATAPGGEDRLREVKQACDAIIGDLGQVNGDGYYNGVVHRSDVEHLERGLAALTDGTRVDAGESVREALRAVKAMYEDEIAMLRRTLIAMGRMLPGVALHDDVSSSFLAYLPTELAAAIATPQVEGLTSGEGEADADLIAGVKRALQNPDGEHDGWTDAGLKDVFFRWPTIVHAINTAASPKATATASVREAMRFAETVKAELIERAPAYSIQSVERAHFDRGILAIAGLLRVLTDSGTAATIGGERA